MRYARSFGRLLLIATTWLVCAQAASAQSFPNRPVRLLIPFSPGGSYDAIARMLAQSLGDTWGQQVVVDNRPGAAGRIGAEMAAKATPDGYTFCLFGNNQTIVPAVYRSVPYDLERDFAPVTMVAEIANVLVIHPSVPAKSTSDLVALAKAKPGQLNFGSGGTGGATHLAGEMFKLSSGINIVHVPYKGTAPALVELLGGQVQIMLLNTLNALPHVKSGKLRGLAVTSLKRSRFLPELPTLDESELKGYEFTEWYGILVPAKTPADVIAKLHTDIVKIIGAPETRERLARQGAEPVTGTPAQLGAFLKTDLAKNARIVKGAGIMPE